MDDRLPLSALLSQVLVAFTIEFDNEFEHSIPHGTTNHGTSGGSDSGRPRTLDLSSWSLRPRFRNLSNPVSVPYGAVFVFLVITWLRCAEIERADIMPRNDRHVSDRRSACR